MPCNDCGQPLFKRAEPTVGYCVACVHAAIERFNALWRLGAGWR